MRNPGVARVLYGPWLPSSSISELLNDGRHGLSVVLVLVHRELEVYRHPWRVRAIAVFLQEPVIDGIDCTQLKPFQLVDFACSSTSARKLS